MNPTTAVLYLPRPTCYELRFMSLFHGGRGLSFPCGPRGDVQIDSLSDRARANYFYARAVIGREFAFPEVVAH